MFHEENDKVVILIWLSDLYVNYNENEWSWEKLTNLKTVTVIIKVQRHDTKRENQKD